MTTRFLLPTADEIKGMDWWNDLSEAPRKYWMHRAGDTGDAADAWAVFKATEATTIEKQLPEAGRHSHFS